MRRREYSVLASLRIHPCTVIAKPPVAWVLWETILAMAMLGRHDAVSTVDVHS